eukprot:3836635-Amphidinium_carterae.1
MSRVSIGTLRSDCEVQESRIALGFGVPVCVVRSFASVDACAVNLCALRPFSTGKLEAVKHGKT